MLQESITRERSLRRWQDYVVPQRWESFTEEDHAVWDLLFARQVELLGSRVVSPFFDGIDLLKLKHPGVHYRSPLQGELASETRGRNVSAVPLTMMQAVDAGITSWGNAAGRATQLISEPLV